MKYYLIINIGISEWKLGNIVYTIKDARTSLSDSVVYS